MKITKLQRRMALMDRLSALGFSREESEQLRRIEMTLQRWAELECGDGNDHCSWSIERDEATDKPFMVRHPHTGKSTRSAIADREKGALKRLDAIIAAHPGLVRFHQTDPRGCALYILKAADVNGHAIDSIYNRGVAVCD